MQKWKRFVRSSLIDYRFRGLPELGFGVFAIHYFFSWLALLFLELYRSFTKYEWGGSLDVYWDLSFFLCVG